MTTNSPIPVIITGPRRSGTELLYRLLDGEPTVLNALVEVYLLEYLGIFEDPAIDSFLRYFFESSTHELIATIEERELLPSYRKTVRFNAEGVMSPDQYTVPWPAETVELGLAERLKSAPRSVQGVWDAWFNTIAGQVFGLVEPGHVVIKSPDYGLSGTAGIHYLDRCKVLVTIRDPAFAISSLRRLHSRQDRRPDLSPTRLMTEVNQYLQMWNRIHEMERAHGDCVSVVKMEDLILNTRREMERIAAFLDLPFTDRLLTPTFFSQPWHGDSSVAPLKAVSRAPLDTSRTNNLAPLELEFIRGCLGNFMTRYGYR